MTDTLVSGRARGGNDFRVSFDGYRTNLHKVWDSLLLDKRMREVAKLAAQDSAHHISIPEALQNPSAVDVASIYESFLVNQIRNHTYDQQLKSWLRCPSHASRPEFGCPDFWARDVALLNCAYTWLDAEENEALPEHYTTRIERDSIIDDLIVRAAIRLAAVLNAIFRHKSEYA